MRTNARPIALLTLSGGLALLVSQTAQAQLDRLYVKGDVGGNLTRDTSLREFFGEPLAPNSKIKFEPGVRVGLVSGYHLTDWFAVEGEMPMSRARSALFNRFADRSAHARTNRSKSLRLPTLASERMSRSR